MLGKTRSELISGLAGASELGQWMAYLDLEPPGREHQGMYAGLMAAIHNTSGNYRRAYKPKDFLPKRERRFLSEKEKAMRLFNKAKAIFK